MPLRLVKRHGSANWYLRGTVRGISVDESTGVVERAPAEAIRIKRENEFLDRSIFGHRATATFLEAAVNYVNAGGERRFIEPLLAHFGARPLGEIDQMAVDAAAMALYCDGSPATLNRVVAPE